MKKKANVELDELRKRVQKVEEQREYDSAVAEVGPAIRRVVEKTGLVLDDWLCLPESLPLQTKQMHRLKSMVDKGLVKMVVAKPKKKAKKGK